MLETQELTVTTDKELFLIMDDGSKYHLSLTCKEDGEDNNLLDSLHKLQFKLNLYENDDDSPFFTTLEWTSLEEGNFLDVFHLTERFELPGFDDDGDDEGEYTECCESVIQDQLDGDGYLDSHFYQAIKKYIDSWV